MPTELLTIAAGAGGFDGTVGNGEFDLNQIAGIAKPNASSGVELVAVTVNTQDPLFGTNKMEKVFVVFSQSLAAITAGLCFIQDFPLAASHNLFITRTHTIIPDGTKIFVFGNPMGVDNYTKACLVQWRRVTLIPQITPG